MAKYWLLSFRLSPSNEYSGLISFRIDWFDLLVVQGTLKSLLQHLFECISSLALGLLYGPSLITVHGYCFPFSDWQFQVNQGPLKEKVKGRLTHFWNIHLLSLSPPTRKVVQQIPAHTYLAPTSIHAPHVSTLTRSSRSASQMSWQSLYVLLELPEGQRDELSNSKFKEEALPTSVVSTPYFSGIKVLLHGFTFYLNSDKVSKFKTADIHSF